MVSVCVGRCQYLLGVRSHGLCSRDQVVLSDVVLVVLVVVIAFVVLVVVIVFVGFSMCCFVDFLQGCNSLALGERFLQELLPCGQATAADFVVCRPHVLCGEALKL